MYFVAAALVQLSANPAAHPEPKSFDLPAEPAEKSLKKFSAQSGLEILFATETTAGVRTNAVKGTFPPHEAIDLMLAGTGLVATSTGALVIARQDGTPPPGPVASPPARAQSTPNAQSPSGKPQPHGTLEIMQPQKKVAWLTSLLALITASDPLLAQSTQSSKAAPSDPSTETVLLEAFEVVSQGPDTYTEADAVSATGTATPVKRLPAFLNTFNRQFIEDIGSDRIKDILAYDSSVSRAGLDRGGDQPQSIRGYNASILRDGFTWFGTTSNAASIERVEVVKGPTAVLYGVGTPGGAVNMIMRKPSPRRETSVLVATGSWERAEATLNHTGPVDAGKRLLYRVDASWYSVGSFVDWEQERRRFVSGSLTWRPTSKVKLNATYELLDGTLHPGNQATGYAPDATHPQREWVPESVLPITYNDGGPQGFDKFTHSAWNLDAQVALTEWLAFRGRIMYLEKDVDWHFIIGAVLRRDLVKVPRIDYTRLESQHRTGNKMELVFNRPLSRVANLKLLLGAESYGGRAFTGDLSRFLPTIPNAPTAGVSPEAYQLFSPADLRALDRIRVSEASFGTYVYYATGILSSPNERLNLLGGIRTDKDLSWKKESTVPQFGLTAEVAPGIILWGSYSESHQLTPQIGPDGVKLPDQVGKGAEFGVKLSLFNDRLFVTASKFHLVLGNIPRQQGNFDPVTSEFKQFFVPSGVEQSDGYEIEANFSASKQLTFKVGATYLDTEIVSNVQQPFLEGLPVIAAPKYSLVGLARYRFIKGPLAGWSLFFGMNNRSSARVFDLSDRLQMFADAVTVTRAGLSFPLTVFRRKSTIQLNVDNLFDEHYRQQGAQWGRPRNFRLSARTNF